MGVGAGLYMCDVVVKSSRSLSHLLMSSCYRWNQFKLIQQWSARSVQETSLIFCDVGRLVPRRRKLRMFLVRSVQARGMGNSSESIRDDG